MSLIHQDHLGFTSVITDESGAAYAAATGLCYYNARYYDPTLARFISPDTIVPGVGDPQAWNRYAYVLGNPLRYTDPSGNDHMENQIAAAMQLATDNWADSAVWWSWNLVALQLSQYSAWHHQMANNMNSTIEAADNGNIKLRSVDNGTIMIGSNGPGLAVKKTGNSTVDVSTLSLSGNRVETEGVTVWSNWQARWIMRRYCADAGSEGACVTNASTILSQKSMGQMEVDHLLHEAAHTVQARSFDRPWDWWTANKRNNARYEVQPKFIHQSPTFWIIRPGQ